ncbi:metal cation symporter ZIP8 [Trichomycterus rosablanca]|uniref:metal cation symporter ZIP8 n=1 Tax=Trichomycterus rosablanca TaxID=2290929 RepID=UPI002F35EF7E
MCGFLSLLSAVYFTVLLSKSAGFTDHIQEDFLQDLVQIYGQNGLLDQNGIHTLVQNIAQKKPAESKTLSTHAQCMSAVEILTLYRFNNLTHLGTDHLRTICPTLLNQALLPNCSLTAFEPKTHIADHVWGYGFLSVTIINLSSLLGLVLIPFTKKAYFPKVLTYFIGLAIGTLFSNAVLQLIPEALGFDPKADNYILKAIGIFGGFYLLFFTEKLLKMVLKTDHEHDHGHFSQQNGGTVITTTVFATANNDKTNKTMSLEMPVEQTPVSRGCCTRLAGVKTVAWMVTLSDALHNFIDGLAIGASFTVSVLAGFSTSIAIVCEEFPHELGDFVILLNSGMSIRQAALFNLLSAMSCYMGLVLGILLGSSFAPNVIFAFAGGMFLYISLADMFPEMNSIAKEHRQSMKTDLVFFIIQNAGLLTGFSIILLITMFAGEINLV